MTNERSTGFDRFDLHRDVLRGVRAAGYESPRPIQTDTIPAALDGRDVLGLAPTGTGKTAAFALPILDWIAREPGEGPSALIVAPTRELATQIAGEFDTLGRHMNVKVATIFGGVSARPQIQTLRRRPDVIVACPGRLLDHIREGHVKLDAVGTLVLDEADHMFDMGFLPDVRRILRALPADRQNLLFSATMPKEIRRLADEILVEPKVVELAHRAPASTIDHALCMVADREKRSLLEHLLERDDCETAIVFTRTKHRARRLAEQLTRAGHRAVGLQGNMSQNARDRAMKGFRDRRHNVLVATDIVARGIDVSSVSAVINYDVPNTPEAYTHRIGRTGRSENEGVAYTFVTGDDRDWVRATEKMIGQPIARCKLEGFEAVPEERGDEARRSSGRGQQGGRPRRRSNGGGGARAANGGGTRNGSSNGGSGRGRSSRRRRAAR